ncbi:Saccharopine dehydrogenase [Penicillium chermesinum]|nr:Saccharopine dehydrogenase [Penicillium chermesinum]
MVGQVAGSKVLLLGSGFVTKPTVDVLAKAGVHVTVACRTLDSAKKLAEGFQNTTAISIDVNDEAALVKATEQHDLVISLIPYTYHATVIKAAIKAKKHVVTTSYVSPAMEELDAAAKEAGITVMNEIGVGAVKTISEVHAAGGKVTGFISFCGGLPAPEASNNPLGYKFSWSSRGVLLALRNAAKILKDGQVVSIDGPDLMATAKPIFIYPGFAFVGYPNRDSVTSVCQTGFRERYGIPEVQNLVRGTLRYQGFPEFIKALVDTGFLNDEAKPFFNSSIPWKEATRQLLGAASSDEKDLIAAVEAKARFPSTEERDRILAGFRWIGHHPRGNALDTLCAVLEQKMQYAEGERDMVMLQHKFEIENKDGSKEVRTSTLCEYGNPEGYSAMAKLVGVPCGVAVKQVLDGTISKKGILAPMTMDICAPLIKTLREEYGIDMIERTL